MNTLEQLAAEQEKFKERKQDSQLHVKENKVIIPEPFIVKNGSLWYVKKTKNNNGDDEEIFLSRHIPILTKEFQNVERPHLLYEITWKHNERLLKDIVPASTIAIKNELLELSSKGLSVHNNNANSLIKFMDQFLLQNNIETHYAVERLGHIKKRFIHPLLNNIEILATDQGEKMILESFEIKGTSESWKEEVFELIKDSPKAVFMILSSFASVVLKDLNIQPFIVDLSGTTSQGKTTTLRVAASVWGSETLMSEWNATRVSIERKAAFLNSFPLLLDDTRKANENMIGDIIYQFSGGRSKGRGSVKGSQREYTWNNILLSTGETSLNEYAEGKGGAAARIIPLVDEPLKRDHELIFNLYDGIEENYGAIGIEFVKVWIENKEEFIPKYKKVRSHYMSKSKDNEVLSRLSAYYAAVHFVGSILKEKMEFDIDLSVISRLFDEIVEENKAVDKPLQFLEELLTELDRSRIDIYYEYEPQVMKAIFKKDQLYLMPAYIKQLLGIEERQTRKEWLKRGITIPIDDKGKIVDYKSVYHKGKTYRGIPVNMDKVKGLGFNFNDE